MLIRKPVAEVFEAFVNPAITSQFWFTKGSGRLEAGKQIQWDWEMYNYSAQIKVKAIEQNKRLLIDWWSGNDVPTQVEWIFTPLKDGTTFVSITNTAFTGKDEDIVQMAMDSTSGFTLVLAGAKAFLEYNINLNLVLDRFPKGLVEH